MYINCSQSEALFPFPINVLFALFQNLADTLQNFPGSRVFSLVHIWFFKTKENSNVLDFQTKWV